MARLSASEFQELIGALVESEGLGRFQEKLIRSQAVISRRRIASVEALARQLHQLTIGLDRECLPTQVVVALWEELLRKKLTDDSTKGLETVADEINACLTPAGAIEEEKREALRSALERYQGVLAGAVGSSAAKVTMLMRAVPAVASLLRDGSIADSADVAEKSSTE